MKTAEEIFREKTVGKYIFRSINLQIAKEQHQVVYDAMQEYANQKVQQAVTAALNKAAERAYVYEYPGTSGWEVNPESILSLKEEILEELKDK